MLDSIPVHVPEGVKEGEVGVKKRGGGSLEIIGVRALVNVHRAGAMTKKSFCEKKTYRQGDERTVPTPAIFLPGCRAP